MAVLTRGPIKLKRGTIPKPMRITLRGPDGQPLDLSDVRTLRFVLSLREAETPTVDAAMEIIQDVDGDGEIVDKGVAEYVWVAGDLDTEGIYDGEFPIEYTGNSTDRVPQDGYIEFQVLADLG